jgi:hypothetical protein
MLAELKAGSHGHARGVVPLLAAAEELPLRAACLDLVTAFNCVHHFDLGRFLAAVARVLAPGGQLFIYTRTPQQNARTIWGRYFPGFTEHEQRLHSEAAFRDAVRRTDGLTVVATQTFKHPRLSTAGRLRAQAEGRHYSTFSLYTPEELRASIATFLARLPSPEVSWVDEHLLVVVGGSRRNQAEPDGPGSLASRAIKNRALQISAGHDGEAPKSVLAAAGDQLRTDGKRLRAPQHHLQRKSGRAGTPPRQARTRGVQLAAAVASAVRTSGEEDRHEHQRPHGGHQQRVAPTTFSNPHAQRPALVVADRIRNFESSGSQTAS